VSTDERTRDSRRVEAGDAVLEVALVSDRGTVRTENQDGAAVVELGEAGGCVLLLADGMGGHAGGRQASGAAIAAAGDALRTGGSPRESLGIAFAAADSSVGDIGKGESGTTLVVAVITGLQARVANIGDSRAYILRGPTALSITEDHSLIEENIRAGTIDADQAATLPGRNILTRAVTGAGAAPDIFDVDLVPGDVLLLCSDGLWGSVESTDLLGLLAPGRPLDDLAGRLCDVALERGSRDNVTLIACRVETPDD
jgi:serine/threonine protein phosphatase PrpC